MVARRTEQRSEHALRVFDAGSAKEVDRVTQQRDDVPGTVGDGGVIDRSVLLGYTNRVTTHLDHEGRGDRPHRIGCCDAEARIAQALYVHASTGEGQRGM